ncbi:parvalbumin 9 [Mastacembelus armatus]|uniref:Parvalbumin n=1 Tax=Mastacembelus armatus TaxID=205130 RepID=A0A3Q3L8H4_9TELE|nr:parvalbumin, thymic CPV3-like [Mastacembelus armatus]XP_026170553.1 parvalbumin, thymic CPV3-like [Mastacembelus armatus]
MSLANILSEEAMKNAVEDCKDPDTFCYKKFFQLCGLSSKSEKEIENVFQILDKDKSGYIEESELKYFLQWFDTSARTLTEKETKNFISAADDNNDGRIGVEEFHIMVSRSSAS